jgi:hypothetical protein
LVLQLKRGHANCSGTSMSSAFFGQVDYFRLVGYNRRSAQNFVLKLGLGPMRWASVML